MAANFEILGINSLDIPITDDLKCMRPVNTDAEIIVNEILHDIFDKAVRKSEDGQQKVLNEKTYTENTDTNTSELIDLTRNYKQEFRILLQNLKCQSHKTTTGNSSLEDQIKKVIDEIKCLETSIRLSLDDGRGDPEVVQDLKFNPVEHKAEVTDLVNCREQPPRHIFIEDDDESEEIIQVVDLEEDTVDFSNNFPSDDELEDITLNDDLERPHTARSCQLPRTNDDEIIVVESGSNIENPSIQSDEKKKTLGKRIWNIITKNSRQVSVSSLFKKKENAE